MKNLNQLKEYANTHDIVWIKVLKHNCLQLLGLGIFLNFKRMLNKNIKIYLALDEKDFPKTESIKLLLHGEFYDSVYMCVNDKKYKVNTYQLIEYLYFCQNAILSSQEIQNDLSSSKLELLREAEYQLECLKKSIKSLKK